MKTFGNVLLTFLTVVLAVLLCFSTLFAAASAGVRAAFTPEAVYRGMEDLDYASLVLPDGNGGSASLCEIINQLLGGLGVSLTPEQLNAGVRSFSVDTLVASFLQDFRTWLLDDGPAPRLSSYEMAQTVAAGLDPGLSGLLSLFGDPVLMLSGLLENVTESARLDERLETLEPAREILSRGTLIFALSVCAALFLLLVLCRKLSLSRALVWSGCSCAAAGTMLIFAEPLTKPLKNRLLAGLAMPESTADLFVRPLLDELRRLGLVMAIAGLAAAVLAGLIVLIGNAIRRKRETAKAEEAALYGGYPAA